VIYYPVNVSQYEGTPPADDQQQRRHSVGPVYPIVDVARLALAGALTFWTKGSARDAQKWKIDITDSAQLIAMALSTGQYLYSEWCQQQPSGPWAMCDAYKVTQHEWNDHAHKVLPTIWYLKFAISKTGQLLLMVSNHPDGA
jgi:hypothetical protein